eukprot:2713293-Pyramimonas_sp.AAC.1
MRGNDTGIQRNNLVLSIEISRCTSTLATRQQKVAGAREIQNRHAPPKITYMKATQAVPHTCLVQSST